MTDKKDLFKIGCFAAALDVTPSCVKRWILERQIASIKVGRRLIRIPASELERIVREGLRPAVHSRHTNSNNEKGQVND